MTTIKTANTEETYKGFQKHMEESLEQLFVETMDQKKEYDSKFDVTIECNGKKITIPMNADLHESIYAIMTEEIKYIKYTK